MFGPYFNFKKIVLRKNRYFYRQSLYEEERAIKPNPKLETNVNCHAWDLQHFPAWSVTLVLSSELQCTGFMVTQEVDDRVTISKHNDMKTNQLLGLACVYAFDS